MYQIESRYHLIGFAESLIGGRPENQDSCGFSDTPLGALAIVCDGMGGHNGGSTASSLAVQEIIASISSATKDTDPTIAIRDAVVCANEVIRKTGYSNPELEGMGTTLSLLLLNEDAAFITHLGDSRVYQLRSGKKVFRTFDHSMVFKLVENKTITEEEARLSPNSNIITAALGIADTIDVDVVKVAYDKNDRFLLCTDGLWNALPEPKLLKLVCKGDDVSSVLSRTVSRVEYVAKEEKPDSYDNLTAMLIDVKKSSKYRSGMEKRYKLTSILLLLLLVGGAVYYFLTPKDRRIVEGAIKDQETAIASKIKADSLCCVYNEFKEKADYLLSDSSGSGRTEKTIKSDCRSKESNYEKARQKAQRDSVRAVRSSERAKSLLQQNDSLINRLNSLMMLLCPESFDGSGSFENEVDSNLSIE